MKLWKRIQFPAAVVGFLLVSGFLVFQAGVATEHTEHIQQQKTNQDANPTQPKENRLYAFWKWTTHDPVAFYTSVLALFTFVLSVSTIGLWVVTWRGGIRQSRDMEAAIATAQDANKISRDGLIADQRAWVAVGSFEVEGDLVFDAKGGAVLLMSVRISNIGKTPALFVHTDMAVTSGTDELPAAVQEIAAKNRPVDNVHWTRTLLPGDSYRRQWAHEIIRPEDPRGAIPVIYGCTTYRITLDGSVHQTAFVYSLYECEPGKPDDFVDLIRPSKRLGFDKNTVGWRTGPGAFAD